jgi:type IV fimbrial biogenesis protein FimT
MKKNTGYTLIELMTMLAVAAVLLTVGVPQLKIFFQSNRMVANTNDLVTAFNLARSEAIRRGVRVTVCKSSAATTAPSCDIGASWKDGWIVFAEDTTGKGLGNVGAYETASNDFLIRAYGPVSGNNVTITPQNADLDNYVSFTSRGVPKDASGNSQTGVFSICDSRGLTNSSGNVIASGVELNAAGNVRSTHDAAKIVSCP